MIVKIICALFWASNWSAYPTKLIIVVYRIIKTNSTGQDDVLVNVVGRVACYKLELYN